MTLGLFFLRFSWPMVAVGGVLAVACLTSTWYINRLQADLARTVRDDAARMHSVEVLQIHLRQLRFHSLMFAADPSPARKALIDEDRQLVDAALAETWVESGATEDLRLLDRIERGLREYKAGLVMTEDASPQALGGRDLIRWADDHPVRDLLVPCRELAERQRERMTSSLERSESQTVWAGRVLQGLGFVGALGGLVSGYATARGLSRRVAKLYVRVQAVQSHLEQDVGAMTVVDPPHLADLDEQLDRVVDRVKDVCHRLQEQERDLLIAEQLAAVGQLAAGVAHEVRNPLTGIKLLVDAALRPANPSPLTPDDLHLIQQEIARLERTVQGLLDFARTPRSVRQPCDIRGLIAEAVEIARGRAELKSAAIRTESAAYPLVVRVEPDQFKSLMTNLLFNAIDASLTGGTVDVRAIADAEDMIRVEVADTGPGIDPAMAGRLFTPFATTKATGTGLGLAVARRVAREHGGDLTAASRPGGGACFTVILPAAETAHAEVTRRG
ncbi:ATP-binding protein [Fimbriiglobus ruber]|uniref:histidine kinase n=1 Tax=Fimbriiglobus ruber TaxID=1908690 RepID=A0A225E024_9BACT|nr:ATP-binding protein [Fimbriiglobus ruber]OWK43356.1 Two-component sensor PilS [Fimbriiglobus ruber]